MKRTASFLWLLAVSSCAGVTREPFPDGSFDAPPALDGIRPDGFSAEAAPPSPDAGPSDTMSALDGVPHADATSHPGPAPSCNDQVKNGSETDVDCGGSCSAKCVSLMIDLGANGGANGGDDAALINQKLAAVKKAPSAVAWVKLINGPAYLKDADQDIRLQSKLILDFNGQTIIRADKVPVDQKARHYLDAIVAAGRPPITDVEIRGPGIIDGNSSVSTATQGTDTAILFRAGHAGQTLAGNITISDLTIRNMPGVGIRVQSQRDIIVRRVSIPSAAKGGIIFAFGAQHITVDDCTVTQAVDDALAFNSDDVGGGNRTGHAVVTGGRFSMRNVDHRGAAVHVRGGVNVVVSGADIGPGTTIHAAARVVGSGDIELGEPDCYQSDGVVFRNNTIRGSGVVSPPAEVSVPKGTVEFSNNHFVDDEPGVCAIQKVGVTPNLLRGGNTYSSPTLACVK